MYGRGNIVGVLNATLQEDELQPGQDILVVLVHEFGFTSKASIDVGGSSRMGVSPRKAGPFTNCPISSPAKHLTEPPSVAGSARNAKGSGKEIAVEDKSSETATQLSSPPRLGSPSMAGAQTERQQGLNSEYMSTRVQGNMTDQFPSALLFSALRQLVTVVVAIDPKRSPNHLTVL